jgi:hypothetical protein
MTISTPRPWVILIVCWLVVLQAGCVQLTEGDSTHEPRYKEALGKRYVTVQELGASGIRRELGTNATETDYVLILTPRGIMGPEVTQTRLVPIGTRLRVVGVMTHKLKLAGTIRYVVVLENFDLGFGAGKEIRINDAQGFKMYERPRKKGEAPKLNPEFFRLISDQAETPNRTPGVSPTAASTVRP